MGDNCFVIMPYGTKKDANGRDINFDEIYKWVIRAAIAKVDGLTAVRCDDIELPGPIHREMIRHISEDRVAIVDTTTLNPNVFYELGIRHALKKSITVLLRQKETVSPFNTAGMNCIEYTTGPQGVEDAKEQIATFIKNALATPEHVDSLVHDILPQLLVQTGAVIPPKRLTKVEAYEYSLKNVAGKWIGLLTGDREFITQADIWVNSENVDMQMDSYYGKSTSATIRYLGAKKDPDSQRVVEDTIGNELGAKVRNKTPLDPATVIVTAPGELRQQVKFIFHVAAVRGEPREGYRPIERIERCVTSALKRAQMDDIRAQNATSILFPIFGTGPAGADLEASAGRCFNAALDFLESYRNCSVERVLFYIWTDRDLAICQNVLKRNADRLSPVPA